MSRPRPASIPARASRRGGERGAVLLEVVLALVLFVGAATVLTSGLSASLDGVERLRRNTHAADLAVTVHSELQLGIKSTTVSGPQPFEAPLEAWTWEVIVEPLPGSQDESSPYQKIEVVIRHEDSALVYRLSQVLRLGDVQSGGDPSLEGTDSY